MTTQPLHPSIIRAAHDAVRKHGSVGKASRALGIARSTLQNRLKHQVDDMPSNDPPKKCGRSLAEFRGEHDKSYIVPQKIKDGLAQLGEAWEYEAAFCQMAGVSVSDLARYREQFSDYYVVVSRSGKRAWSGSKTTANKMREMIA